MSQSRAGFLHLAMQASSAVSAFFQSLSISAFLRAIGSFLLIETPCCAERQAGWSAGPLYSRRAIRTMQRLFGGAVIWHARDQMPSGNGHFLIEREAPSLRLVGIARSGIHEIHLRVASGWHRMNIQLVFTDDLCERQKALTTVRLRSGHARYKIAVVCALLAISADGYNRTYGLAG